MRADIVASLAFAALFGYLVVESGRWNYRSALFPEVIGAAGLMAVALFVLVRIASSRRASPESHPTSSVDGDSVPAEADRARALRLLAWIVGVVVLSWLLGQMLAMSLFILAFLHYESSVRWPNAVLAACLTGGFLYLIFDRLLMIAWLDGAVFGWLGPAFR
jgi:hypothetical protein